MKLSQNISNSNLYLRFRNKKNSLALKSIYTLAKSTCKYFYIMYIIQNCILCKFPWGGLPPRRGKSDIQSWLLLFYIVIGSPHRSGQPSADGNSQSRGFLIIYIVGMICFRVNVNISSSKIFIVTALINMVLCSFLKNRICQPMFK